MLKREIKINWKSFCIWLSILLGLFFVVFLIYPSIMNSENVKLLDDLLIIFPQEVLKVFNMDIAKIDTAFGWIQSEGFIFVILIVGSYAGILGSHILLKEESDKTIEYLNMLPIQRSQIVRQKMLCGIGYIIAMVVLLGMFNYIGLSLSGSFDKKTFLLLSITPIFSSVVIFILCMFLSTFTHKTKKMIGISLAIVFISYVMQMLSVLAESTEFLKFFSIFTLADIRYVITYQTINPWMIALSIIITTILGILTLRRYEKKELI